MPEQLITKQDIIDLKSRVSINIVDTHIINQMVIDAQRLDVRPQIGEAFYYDVVTNVNNTSPVPSAYDKLFNGTTYARKSDGLTVDFYGLKPVVINYSFARILENINLFFTRAGAKYKDTDTSTRASQQELISYVNTARSQAIAYMNDVNDYLEDNKESFSIWVQDCQINRTRSVQSFANKKNPTNINFFAYRSKKY